ncbi:hypothetical protein KCH_20020 [Kitasatospora cheerisanensis KCTC 2395]|uniref:Uncharacterized protein n=1 Tax=Kitasatospora cheerisanensis KCTC 2395 TaxID=1348663 RepID=A0A066Z7S3_9ACTN|nr:hypothetical protein KCH_20020 [Kitasatospora cheerisanensis KCTC 2395]
MKVTVRLPGPPGSGPRYDRHVAARIDEPARVRHLADVLYGGTPETAEELWRRHPGCAVLAVLGADGSVHVHFRGGASTIRLADAAPNGAPDATVVAGSLVHALLAAGAVILR